MMNKLGSRPRTLMEQVEQMIKNAKRLLYLPLPQG